MNKVIPGRTKAEFREENKEAISVYQNQYNQDNMEKKKQYSQQYETTHKEERRQYKCTHREELNQYCKQYKQTHKKIRKCSCGVEFNDGRTDRRNQHYGSKHHIEFVNDFYERLHRLLVPEDSNDE